jgi:hypothetical protein
MAAVEIPVNPVRAKGLGLFSAKKTVDVHLAAE